METLLGVLAGLVILGTCFALLGRRSIKQRNLIRDTPTTPIGKIGPGFVEVKGRIVAGEEELISPWSQKPCVHFDLLVEKKTRSNNTNSDTWRTMIKDKQTRRAKIDDGTGQVAVDLARAHLLLSQDSYAQSGVFKSPPPALKELVERYGRSTKGWVLNKTMRYEETALEIGSEVYAIGMAVRVKDGLEIKKGGPVFLVTDQGEARAVADRRRSAIVSFSCASVCLVGIAICLYFLVDGTFSSS